MRPIRIPLNYRLTGEPFDTRVGQVTSVRGWAGTGLAVDGDPAPADQGLLFLYARSAW
jgi:hypothetical protein